MTAACDHIRLTQLLAISRKANCVLLSQSKHISTYAGLINVMEDACTLDQSAWLTVQASASQLAHLCCVDPHVFSINNKQLSAALDQVGLFWYRAEGQSVTFMVAVYVLDLDRLVNRVGEPSMEVDTDSHWFDMDRLPPPDQLTQDFVRWFPFVRRGEKFVGSFSFVDSELRYHTVHHVDQLPSVDVD